MKFGDIKRLWQIQRVVNDYGLREFFDGKSRGKTPRAERLRLALEELGPVFIKLGQALSTRPDIVPPDIALELAKLQDRVAPFPGTDAQKIVEEELGKPIRELFAEFDLEPLASASVAQVHTARLKPMTAQDEGMQVVVKVLRPGIETTMQADIALLHTLAEWAERLSPTARRIRPRAVVVEYEKALLDELDMMREGANAALLRRNWQGSELIYHPLVLWDFTKTRVLTMERIHGISIRELDRLRSLGVDFQVLAERGVEIFFRQTFVHNFFHADMHPGNIFVDASNPKQPSYLAVDFGIVGTLTPDDQRYLAENFYAFFNRDYRRIAELHLESGWLPEGTRVEEFEAAIRTISEPIFQRPIKDISFGFFLVRLFQIARRFNYQVQPQLVLLQKTLLQVEGLGRQLYGDLDLWKTAKPIMEAWMRNRLSPTAAVEQIRARLPQLAQALPQLADHVLKQSRQSHSSARELQILREEIRRSSQRNLRAISGSALLIMAALLHADWMIAAPLAVAGLWQWWRAGRNA